MHITAMRNSCSVLVSSIAILFILIAGRACEKKRQECGEFHRIR